MAISAGEALLFVLIPQFQGICVFVLQEEIDSSVDDLEVRRIGVEVLFDGHAEGTPSAIGWDVFVRVAVEFLLGFGTYEVVQLSRCVLMRTQGRLRRPRQLQGRRPDNAR